MTPEGTESLSNPPPPVPRALSGPGRLARKVYRAVRATLAAAMLVLLVLVFTPIPETVYNWLDVASLQPEKADVIIVCGGRHERLLWAAELFDRGLASRVIVSNAPGAAQHMQGLLARCGVPRTSIGVDAKSYTTFDHPASIAKLPGIDPQRQRFIVITDHEHSRRVAGVFRSQGYNHFTIYAGPHPLKMGERPIMWRWRILYLPRIAYECAGLLQYKVQGKI